jgi:hypothetical protein
MSIEWTKFEGDRRKTFEDFCFQIVNLAYSTPIRVDDSGGGDGVEFYIKNPDGTEWGWQTKFFFPNLRLNVSKRKEQIKKSLEKAIEIHGINLKRFYLCTPEPFTTGEFKWLMEELLTEVPHHPDLEIIHWHKDKFEGYLLTPKFTGIKNYFFSELELDIEWFKTQAEKQLLSVKSKYNPAIHTDRYVDLKIHGILGDSFAIKHLLEIKENYLNQISKYEEKILMLKSDDPKEIDWENSKEELIVRCEDLLTRFQANISRMDKVIHEVKSFINNSVSADGLRKSASEIENLRNKLDKESNSFLEYKVKSLVSESKHENKSELEYRVRSITRLPYSYSSKVIVFLIDFIDYLTLQNRNDFHVFGNAGLGKTHTAANISNDKINNNLPNIFISANKFSGCQSIEKRMLEILDVPTNYGWNDFLKTLQSVSMAYRTRIPIIIDGLNETILNGYFSTIWKKGLESLIFELKNFNNLCMITTCRTSYKEAVWENDSDCFSEEIYQFSEQDAEILRENYFEHYRIITTPTPVVSEHFAHPLFLRIFCETVNPDRSEEITINLGEQYLFETFENYLKRCNNTFCEKLKMYKKLNILMPIVNIIADFLWKEKSRTITISQAFKIVDGKELNSSDWENSKTRILESEGLLIFRDMHESEEEIGFTYDLMAGFLIASSIINLHQDDLNNYLNDPKIEKLLFGEWNERHPLAEDICECLCVVIPSKLGLYLHDLVDYKRAFNSSINSLFEINPEFINQDAENMVLKLFNTKKNRPILFDNLYPLFTRPNHPFNARFLHRILMTLSLTERDLCWTEFIRKEIDFFQEMITNIEDYFKEQSDLSDEIEEMLHTSAYCLMWCLTSTVRPLRDLATRALYYYGRKFPEKYFGLMQLSFTIDDPYVRERMLASGYGVSMAKHSENTDKDFLNKKLVKIAHWLYNVMFLKQSEYSTTHVIIRDYARMILELCKVNNSSEFSVYKLRRIRPPYKYGGIRDWGCLNEDESLYRDGNMPIHMDFQNYTIGRLVRDRRNYDFGHEEYKSVFGNIIWRIKELGYYIGDFSEVDKEINRHSFYDAERKTNAHKTVRYGKKYSWIAYYELLGHRRDIGGLVIDWVADLRSEELEIDPSFPITDKTNYTDLNLMEPDNLTLGEWQKEIPFDTIQHLIINNKILKESDDWILLSNFEAQGSKEIDRNMHLIISTYFVELEDVDKFKSIINKKKDFQSLYTPTFHRTFLGEIPWWNTFPYNKWEKLEEDIEYDNTESQDTYMEIITKTIPNENAKNGEANVSVNGKDYPALNISEESRVIKIPIHAFESSNKKRKFVKYQSSIIQNQFDSEVNQELEDLDGRLPSRQIIEHLNLSIKPQSFNMYDVNGNVAYMFYRKSESYHQHFHYGYMRKDLVEKYLKENNLALLWLINIEKSEYLGGTDGRKKNIVNYRYLRVFGESDDIRSFHLLHKDEY